MAPSTQHVIAAIAQPYRNGMTAAVLADLRSQDTAIVIATFNRLRESDSRTGFPLRYVLSQIFVDPVLQDDRIIRRLVEQCLPATAGVARAFLDIDPIFLGTSACVAANDNTFTSIDDVVELSTQGVLAEAVFVYLDRATHPTLQSPVAARHLSLWALLAQSTHGQPNDVVRAANSLRNAYFQMGDVASFSKMERALVDHHLTDSDALVDVTRSLRPREMQEGMPSREKLTWQVSGNGIAEKKIIKPTEKHLEAILERKLSESHIATSPRISGDLDSLLKQVSSHFSRTRLLALREIYLRLKEGALVPSTGQTTQLLATARAVLERPNAWIFRSENNLQCGLAITIATLLGTRGAEIIPLLLGISHDKIEDFSMVIALLAHRADEHVLDAVLEVDVGHVADFSNYYFLRLCGIMGERAVKAIPKIVSILEMDPGHDDAWMCLVSIVQKMPTTAKTTFQLQYGKRIVAAASQRGPREDSLYPTHDRGLHYLALLFPKQLSSAPALNAAADHLLSLRLDTDMTYEVISSALEILAEGKLQELSDEKQERLCNHLEYWLLTSLGRDQLCLQNAVRILLASGRRERLRQIVARFRQGAIPAFWDPRYVHHTAPATQNNFKMAADVIVSTMGRA